MSYLIPILTSVVSAVLVYILQMLIKENRDLKDKRDNDVERRQKALEEGVLCLLRKELIDSHEKWTTKGYITSKALENGLKMLKAYRGLGGNGMMDQMEEEIRRLPIHD